MKYEKLLKFLTDKNVELLSKFDTNEKGELIFNGDILNSPDYMKKEIYDADKDGIVDAAKSLKDLTTTVKFLNELPNEIIEIKELINNSGNSSLEVLDTTDQLPEVSKEKTLYIVINDITTNGSCIYLGKDNHFINLFEHLGEGSGTGGNGTGKPIFQSVKLDVKAGQKYKTTLPIDKRNNDIMVQCFKFIPGETDIVEILKDFNLNDDLDFIFNKKNIIFDGSLKIKDEFEYKSTLNENGIYETETIDKNVFIQIKNIL